MGNEHKIEKHDILKMLGEHIMLENWEGSNPLQGKTISRRIFSKAQE